jgi:hypothetical protein
MSFILASAVLEEHIRHGFMSKSETFTILNW